MSKKRVKESKPVGIWGRLFDTTFGNGFRFFLWSITAIIISILIEWVGILVGWWDKQHSRQMLIEEVNYLNDIGKNAILNIYPKDIANTLLSAVDSKVTEWGLQNLSDTFSGIFLPVAYAIEAAINILYVFIVRFAVVAGILPGLIVIFLLALVDGLSERNIRTFSGGIESSFLYHHAKRMMLPSVIVFCGLYLTLPFSLNPLWFFLPLLFIFWLITFITASSFKKSL